MNTTQTNNTTSHDSSSKTLHGNSTKNQCSYKGGFDRAKLPKPSDYFAQRGLKLTGKGAWRDAVCPFHNDTKPSLRVRVENGAFSCMVCGAHGGDVLAFHQQRHGLTFKAAAIALGAWIGGAK